MIKEQIAALQKKCSTTKKKLTAKFLKFERRIFEKTHVRIITAAALLCVTVASVLCMEFSPWVPKTPMDVSLMSVSYVILIFTPYCAAIFILTKFMRDGGPKKIIRGIFKIIWISAVFITILVFLLSLLANIYPDLIHMTY